jgi:hypothetical protein
MAAAFAAAGVSAQVLNTRPLSQPYVNPSNPNAGQMGGQIAPGDRQTLERRERELERRAPLARRQGCWIDSMGRYRCPQVR